MQSRHSLSVVLTAFAVFPFLGLLVAENGADSALDLVRQDQLLHGPYFGQDPPGIEPEIFAPGFVSTASAEGCIVFSADGKRVVFRRLGYANLLLEGYDSPDVWTIERVPTPFARLDWYNGDFTLAPDGRSFYFSSTRPLDSVGRELEYSNIWVVNWTNSGWGEADFYIAFRQEDGSWSEPVNMGEPINSPADENRPFVTLDGRYFFFTSDRVVQDAGLAELRADLRPGNGSRDVYWVDAAVINQFRPR
jgi:hypothetical protein